MEVQKFIREKGWQALKDELFIEVREYDHGLRVLNYSMIESPKMHPVVAECRALKLDTDGNVVSRAFNRFFNFGEAGTENFDFSNCTVWEKADGSLCPVYFCPQTNQWEISTRGTGFAEANHVFGTKRDCTFREAILDAMRMTEQEFQACMSSVEFHKSCTYVMEYCSPFNRIVTPYSEPHMVLLAVVSNITHIEANNAGLAEWTKLLSSKGMNIRMPKVYHVSSGDALVKLAESLDNLQEGFVVVDHNTGKRVKCKSSHYVLVHQMRGNGTPTMNNLLELVAKNEQDELLAYFPEYKVFIDPVEDALRQLKLEASLLYNHVKDIESQKDFAIRILSVVDPCLSPILFKARKDNVSTEQAFMSLSLSQQCNLIEKFVGGKWTFREK
jgi:hypothetical protein